MAAPVFDAQAVSAGSGVVSNTVTLSWNQDVGAGANNAGIIWAVCSNLGSAGGVVTGTPTASIGGTSLTYLGTVLMGNVAIGGFIAAFAAQGVPSGTGKTMTFTIACAGQNFGNVYGVSATYTGVGGIGALQTNFGSDAAPTVTVPSATGRLVCGCIGDYNTGTHSSPSFTQRTSQESGQPPFLVAGDMAAAASTVFSATQSSALAWAAAAFELQPVGAATNRFFPFF